MTSRGAWVGVIILAAVTAGGCERAPRQKPTAAARIERLNVLLITLDTTRADRLGCYGYAAAQTPALDALAASGVRFERAFCQVPLTLPSHASLLSGTCPPSNGLRINAGGALGPGIPTVAEVFKNHGYQTAAFIAAWVLDSAFGLDRGFDHYDDQLGADVSVSGEVLERRADAVADAAVTWIEAHAGAPFFAWVHFFDPHHPYDPPPPYRDRLTDPYDGEIAFLDAQVHRLVEGLAARGLQERTLLVVVGDHGESFEEHDEPQHGLLLYNTTLQVPLIFSGAGRLPAGQTIAGVVRLIDVMPTVLELLGWEAPEGLEGRSLVSTWRKGGGGSLPAYGESEYGRRGFGWASLTCLITDRWKYIQGPRPELYDRAADPGEFRNVIAQHPDTAEELRAQLDEWVSKMKPRQAAAVQANAEALAKLSGLGYVGGGTPGEEGDASASRRDPKEMLPVYRGLLRAKTLARQGAYAEVVTLLEPLLEQSPESGEVRGTLGEAYLEVGRFPEAEQQYAASLRSLPHDPVKWCGLGDALYTQGKAAQARDCFAKALEVSSGYGQAHSRLGRLFAQQGDFPRAYEHFRKYVELSPRSPNALSNLANVLLPLQRPGEAVDLLQRALTHDPAYAPAHQMLWRALLYAGRPAAAMEALRTAHQVLPGDRTVTCDLAWWLCTSSVAELRNGTEALDLARQCYQATPSDPRGLDILAAAYAETGAFAQAVQTARQAAALAGAQGQVPLQRQIESRLQLYLTGQPCRE